MKTFFKKLSKKMKLVSAFMQDLADSSSYAIHR